VEVGEAEGVGCDVPAGREPEEIGEGRAGVPGSGGQDGVDGGVGVLDGCGVLGGEFREVVLVSPTPIPSSPSSPRRK